MKKFWMMGGAVIAVSVAALVWAGPVRSSENLLNKAQAEFAAKARDALIQRQMVQAPALPTVSPAPKSAPTTEVIASLEPVAAPETPVEIKVPETKTLTVASLETPPLSRETVAEPVTPPAPAPEPMPAPAAEVASPAKIQLAALPQESQAAVSPKPVAAAPVAEVAKVETPAVTRTYDEPKRQYKAERKPRNAQRERRHDDDYRSDDRSDYRSNRRADYRSNDRYDDRSDYRSERRAPRNYNLESLRSRAPEIAAAIARYMD